MFYKEGDLGRHWQRKYTDVSGRLLLLKMEQLSGNVHVFLEYWAGKELVSRADGNVRRGKAS